MTPAKRKEIRRKDEEKKRRSKQERTGIPVPPKKRYPRNSEKKRGGF